MKDVRDMSNIEFLTNMMEFSRNGGMMQLFVVQAVEKYADQCIEEIDLSTDFGLISAQAWKRTAIEAKERLEEKYGRKEKDNE